MDEKTRVAQELVRLAKMIAAEKGEVPEAFKKQWKKNEGEKDEDEKKDKEASVAHELVKLAKDLAAFDDEMEMEEIDPAFAMKVRMLKQGLPGLTSKKNRALRKFGIGMLRGNNTVEELVDAMLRIVSV